MDLHKAFGYGVIYEVDLFGCAFQRVSASVILRSGQPCEL